MIIDHIRFVSTSEETAAQIYIDGKFQCYVLEDQHNSKKVYGETRIPAGDYHLALRKDGTMHVSYSKKFTYHVGMLEIMGIPEFSRVYYHIGNNDDETLGCPLTANQVSIKAGRITVTESTLAYEAFYKKVAPILAAGKEVKVRVRDQDVNLNNLK